MDDGFDLTDDLADLPADVDLLFEAASFAGRYAPGVLPGTDPLEILTGLHVGLTEADLDAVAADDRLRDVIRRHWDAQGVDETLWQVAARDDEAGRRHAALLASCGYHRLTADLGDEVDRLLWLALAAAPQTLATKGDSVPDATRWTMRCAPLDCDLAVTRADDVYEVAFVPEVDAGTGRVLARWNDGTVDAVDATFVAQRLVRVRFSASGRALDAVAVALPTEA